MEFCYIYTYKIPIYIKIPIYVKKWKYIHRIVLILFQSSGDLSLWSIEIGYFHWDSWWPIRLDTGWNWLRQATGLWTFTRPLSRKINNRVGNELVCIDKNWWCHWEGLLLHKRSVIFRVYFLWSCSVFLQIFFNVLLMCISRFTLLYSCDLNIVDCYFTTSIIRFVLFCSCYFIFSCCIGPCFCVA